MITPKCTHKGCDWVGKPKDSASKAAQAVAMHVGRIHTKNIPTYRGPLRRRKHAEANGHTHANGHGQVAVALPESTRGRNQPTTAGKKRPYTRRQPAATPAAGTEVKINHCYNCGADIECAAQGIVLADLIKRNSKFRAKVEKLLAAS